jgi:hypothetical protein
MAGSGTGLLPTWNLYAIGMTRKKQTAYSDQHSAREKILFSAGIIGSPD